MLIPTLPPRLRIRLRIAVPWVMMWRGSGDNAMIRSGYEFRTSAEFGKLIRTREQRQDAVADQVGGGEVAGYQQQIAGNNSLALSKPILRLLGRDKRADEVVAAPAASLIDRTREIIIEALACCRQLCRLLGRP